MYDGMNFTEHDVVQALSEDKAHELVSYQSSRYLHEGGDEIIDSIDLREVTKEEYQVLNKYI